MNDNIRSKVIDLLESTPTRIRNIELLCYELQNPVSVSPSEMIDVLNFGHGDDECHAANHVSNKTMNIALNYLSETEKANEEIVREITIKLYALEREQKRLEKYISYLNDRQKTVLKGIYFDVKPIDTVARENNVSVKTIRRIKSSAVDTLCDMFSITDVFGG